MIYDAVHRLGDFDVVLELDAAPADVVEGLDLFGHVVVVPGRVTPDQLGDDLLTAARWAGIIRRKAIDPDGELLTIGGPGMSAWLGDEDGKGQVLESPVVFAGDDFATVIAGLLPDAVTAGTITNPSADVFSGSFQYVDPRTAIDYVAGLFDGYYRVNPDGTLDAGPASALFVTTPTAVIARRAELPAGVDVDRFAAAGRMGVDEDAADYTTRVVLLAENDDGTASIATGTADAAAVPYVDLHGNPVQRTRIVDEQATSSGNATARAQLQLNRFSSSRRTLALELDDYDVVGAYQPGDTVYVYDPTVGLVDPDTVLDVRGRTITPTTLTVQAVRFPLTPDAWSVLHRAGDGTWTDLTDHVVPESGGAVLEVGDLPRRLTAERGIFGRTYVRGADLIGPDVPGSLAVTGTLYQTADGSTRAALDVTWTEPLNTDGTAVTDGDRYDVRFRRQGSTDWQYLTVPWGTLATRIVEVSSGETYEVGIAARDTSGNASSWSASDTEAVPVDPTAPPTPSAPTASASPLRILVTHDLTASGGGYLDDDLDHLEVHVGGTVGFTPTSGTLAAKLPANAAMIALGIPAVGEVPRSTDTAVYVKVIAVDRTGNASPASAGVAASADLIDSAQIASASIIEAKIGTAAVTEAKIANLAVTNAKIASLDATKITTGFLDAARIAAGSIDASAITAGTITADRIVAGSITSTQVSNGSLTGSDLASSTITGSNVASSTITGGNIASATIVDGNIANATITSAKIASIAADKITTGTLAASTLITIASGGYIQSAGYSAGSTGFRISGNGSAEFNNVTTRGTFYSILTGSAQIEVNGGYVRWVNPLGNTKLISVGSGIIGIYNDALSTRVNVGYNGDAVFGLNGATYYGLTQGTSYTDLKSSSETRIYTGGTLVGRFQSALCMVYMPDSAFFSANVSVQTPNYDLYRVTSSGRNKAGIVTLDRSVASTRLRALRPASYQSTIPADHARYGPDHRANGFIAEELAAVAPELVHWERPVVWLEELEDGPPDPDTGEPTQIPVRRPVEDTTAPLAPISPNTYAILAELVAAWQELDARVDALEAGPPVGPGVQDPTP